MNTASFSLLRFGFSLFVSKVLSGFTRNEIKMWMLKAFSVTAILVLFCGQTDAKPCQDLSRQKRTSDQRLAELETLIALSKMNGKLVTIPIGFGKIDPNKIGRRRRSVSLLLQQLINDFSTEDKQSDEVFHTFETREEDGGEEKESDIIRKDEKLSFAEEFPLKIYRRLPVRLPE